MNCAEYVQTLPHVAPSVQTVICTMRNHAPLTGQQLRDETGLPRRTVYAALQRIKELGLLRERTSLRDSRQTYFWLAVDEAQRPVGSDAVAA